MRSQAFIPLLATVLSAAVSAQDVNIPLDFPTIQQGIDNVGSGGTVFVDPGTYVETLLVDPGGAYGAATGQAAMSIVATGPGVVVQWPAKALRQAAFNPAIQTVSAKQIDAIVHVAGTTALTLDGIAFDGNSDTNTAGTVTSCGVSFRDAAGTVQDCTIQNVQDTPVSGAQGGLGALVEGPLLTTSVTFSGCDFLDNQKGLIVATNSAACDVTSCNLIGRGVTTSLAQNGVQYASGAYGNVSNCVFDGFWWNGPSAFVGTGILGFGTGAPINVSNNVFIDCQVGFYQYGDTVMAVVDDEVTGNVFSQESFPVSANGYLPVGIIYTSIGAGSQYLIQNNSFNGLQDVGVALYSDGGTITGNYFNANGAEYFDYNAQDESTGGNVWNGNTWSNFASNPNYPVSYLVPGAAGAVDNAPDGDCPDFAHTDVAAGDGPSDVILADLTGDGARDVATADDLGDTVTVLANDGDGGFGPHATVALTAGDAPSSLATGNLVAGGGTDLAVAAPGAEAVRIVSNDPVGTLAVSASISTAGAGVNPISVAAGDLNGGGTDDVAVALAGDVFTGGGGVAVILDGAAPVLLDAPVGGFLHPQQVDLCDLDGDGDLDVVVAMSSSLTVSGDNVLLYENDGVGTGGFAAPVTLSVAQNPQALACGDLDGDGDRDLAVAGDLTFPFVDPSAVHVFRNDGLTAGAWSAGDLVLAGSHVGGMLPTDVAIGDLSDDSIPGFFSRRDVFAANFGSVDVTRFNGYVDAVNGFSATQACSAGVSPAAVAIAHLNGDATLDVVVANHESDDVSVMLAVPRALAQKFGTGCPGTGGLVPDISAVGLPTLGNPAFGAKVSNARSFAPALLAISLTQIDVPLGGGCNLYLAPPLVLVQAFTNAGGEATVLLQVPAAGIGLDGVNLYLQYAIFDPFGPYLGQFAFSDGLRIKLGF